MQDLVKAGDVMLCGNKKITIISPRDKGAEQIVYHFKDCSWRKQKKSMFANEYLKSTDETNVRIPLQANCENIEKGSLCLLGDLNIDPSFSFGSLKNIYPDAFVIKNITKNFDGSDYTKHVHVSGAA